MYRILTEYKNIRAIQRVLSRYFPGLTLLKARSLKGARYLKGRGIWERQVEHSVIVEIDTEDEQAVKRAALDIKTVNKQQAVMVQKIPNEVWFL